MKVSSSQNILTISGNIKSVSHAHILAEEINQIIKDFKEIKIRILDSISITSSVIGHLCKLASLGHSIELHVTNKELYGLLDDLKLTQLLKVQHIAA